MAQKVEIYKNPHLDIFKITSYILLHTDEPFVTKAKISLFLLEGHDQY